jgi:pilus assembly protein FimV
LTRALETTIDGHAQVAASGSVDVQLAALGALLPGLVRTPTREQMAEFADRLATLKQAELSGVQKPLAQLLDSVITLLAKLPSHHDAVTEKLINYLYEQLIAVDSQVEMLPEAINRFTDWLLQVSAVMPVIPALSDQSQETPFAYTAKELYFELAELRSHIRDEFAKLRHEMHHHR